MSDIQGYDGSTLTASIKAKRDGSYIDIDNLTELYVYVVDANKNVLGRYSKAGGTVNGYTFTALTRIDAETYEAVLSGAVTKLLENQILYIEINVNESGVRSVGKSELIQMLDTVIKELS